VKIKKIGNALRPQSNRAKPKNLNTRKIFNNMTKNKFCNLSSLRNESDVEQFFVIELLKDLGYKESNILTKHSIPAYTTGKGNKRKSHIPDYLVQLNKTPILIVEAKHPDVDITTLRHEAQDYATIINRGFIGKNPLKFCLISNGIKTELLNYDEQKPIMTLSFEDFDDKNKKYLELKNLISLSSIKKGEVSTEDFFEFRVPEISELKGIFKICHDLIRRKQKIGPKKAFYEFTKLLFIKMYEDKRIQDIIDSGKEVSKEDFIFSTNYIEKSERINKNPINSVFKEYRDDFEKKVISGEKKRIFQKGEELNLNSSTIKSVVELIQNYNLRSVEDDINGKVFETFLESSVRGKELGQFFTPRGVVKFIVKLADLKIRKDKETGEYEPDSVIDGSCGTGGFLIFALSDLFNKVPKNDSMPEKTKKKIKENCLFGIDASEDDIVPVTRMNMYLHGDGGSHIFMADTLDKDILIEEGINSELKNERQELKKTLKEKKFDVVLTNPPFSMKYEAKKEDEKRILEQYEIAKLGGNLSSSLKSNIMFLERYHDLLKEGGKLITVIDESVLNTEGQGKNMLKFREWLRKKYIVRAVISLPKNTFVNQEAGVKTSVMYLTKRKSEREIQPEVFMAISEDVGHNDAGRYTSEWGDLGNILEEYKKFENGEY